MATEVEQRSTNSGHGVGLDMDMDNDTLLYRTEQRPLTLSRRRILYQAPEFIQRLSGEDTVVEGGTAKFECIFKGFPKPTVTWYKDEVPLELNDRISLESFEQGTFALVIRDVVRSDEAPYRCRIENSEGSSSSTLYLSVKGSSRSPKRKKSSSPNRRMVSYPSLFPTIEEKVVEEEKEEEEVNRQEPSPLTKLYDGNKLRSRHTWPKFVGDWAFADDEDAGPSAKGDDDVDSHGESFYANESNDDDEVFADTIPADMLTHTAPLLTEAPSTLHPNFSTSDSNSLSRDDVHGTALSCSHSSLSSSLQTDDNGSSPCDVCTSSSRHCTFCNRNNANSNQLAHQSSNMTSQSTDNDRDRLENDQPLAGRRRHCSSDTDEDSLGGNATSGQDSVASGNQLAVTKKKQPPPKGQRKRPPRKTIDHTGGVLATTFMLSSFTFCALCIDTSPEIFIVAIFMAAFMFQVIQQLNSM